MNKTCHIYIYNKPEAMTHGIAFYIPQMNIFKFDDLLDQLIKQ